MSTPSTQPIDRLLGVDPPAEDALYDEQLITFAQAARLVPRRRAGRPCAVSTIWRWALKGVRAADGTRIRLEYTRVGGTRMTSAEALKRFFLRLTAADRPAEQDRVNPQHNPQRGRRSGNRQEAIAQAEALCRAAGI